MSTFEGLVLDEVMKAHFTDAKIKELAKKVGPGMEDAIHKRIVEMIRDGYMDDQINDALYGSSFSNILSKMLSKILSEAFKSGKSK